MSPAAKAIALREAATQPISRIWPASTAYVLRQQCERLLRMTEPAKLRLGSAAALGICPSCGEATKPSHPTCGDTACIAQEPSKPGVLGRLKDGERSE